MQGRGGAFLGSAGPGVPLLVLPFLRVFRLGFAYCFGCMLLPHTELAPAILFKTCGNKNSANLKNRGVEFY